MFRTANTDYGAILMNHHITLTLSTALLMLSITKAPKKPGIFQSQGWLILAEALRGQGQRAFTYLWKMLPLPKTISRIC